MDPPGTLLAHDPLLAVVGFIKVNLLTIDAVGVLLELLSASVTKSFLTDFERFVLVGLAVVFAELVGTSVEVVVFLYFLFDSIRRMLSWKLN